MALRTILGGPGVSDERTYAHKYVFRDGKFETLPGGGWIDATKSRDCFVSGATAAAEVLQGGLFMGQLTGRTTWTNSFFGKTTAAVLQGATTLTVAALEAVEIVRRNGATGTLYIVGPPVANGPASVGLITYSGINTTTGVITATALGQNETQLLNIQGTPSAGTFRLLFQTEPGGPLLPTGTIAYNATFATMLAAINTALDAMFGTGAIVATGTTYPAITLTYTTARQALGNARMAAADVGALTGATTATVTEVNQGFYGTFIAGSLIGATDGSFFPKSMISPGYGIQVADGSNTAIGGVVQWPGIPIGGLPEFWQCAPVVTDLGIRAWLADQMSGLAPSTTGVSGSRSVGGKFTFPDFYNATA